MTPQTFSTWGGRRLRYFDHPYNSTAANERAVELAIAADWLEEHGAGTGLEVGNVLGHYPEAFDRWPRRIADRYEGPEFVDVFDLADPADWIVAISTLEHVRWDPPEERWAHGAADAVRHLRGLLAPGGAMLITIPLGWHAHLDAAIAAGELEPTTDVVMYRAGDRWARGDRSTWRAYGASTPWADAVWVAEWIQSPTLAT